MTSFYMQHPTSRPEHQATLGGVQVDAAEITHRLDLGPPPNSPWQLRCHWPDTEPIPRLDDPLVVDLVWDGTPARVAITAITTGLNRDGIPDGTDTIRVEAEGAGPPPVKPDMTEQEIDNYREMMRRFLVSGDATGVYGTTST